MNARPSSGESPANEPFPKASAPEQQEKELFPIVGMGASAGGLEAYTQLLTVGSLI